MSRLKIRTLVVAACFFTAFALLSTLQGVRMLEAKQSAQAAFDQLSVSMERCSTSHEEVKTEAEAKPEIEVKAQICDEQTRWKKQFDLHVGRMEHHRSLMLVFLVFAIFLPGLTGGVYLLTQSIFDLDS